MIWMANMKETKLMLLNLNDRLEAKSYQERIDEAIKELESNKSAYLSPTALVLQSKVLEYFRKPTRSRSHWTSPYI